MAEWMKVEKTTPEKVEIDRIAERLSIDPHEAFGKVFLVWRWFDDHTTDGIAHGVRPTKVDRITGLHGFAEAMVDVGWLTILEDGLSLPNFDRHCGETAKRRALTRNRTQKYRKTCDARSVTGSADDVTLEASPEEKRIEEKRKDSPTGEGCAVDAAAMQRVVEAWNQLQQFRRCKNLSDKRTRTLKARLSNPEWSAHWAEALARIRDSKFCAGERGWVATFDWFIKPDTVTKIREGQYDNAEHHRHSGYGAGQVFDPTTLGEPGQEF